MNYEVLKEKYGDALLSRYPIENIRKYTLPKPRTMKWLEPRGAVEIVVEIRGTEIRIINTHLGLTNSEKIIQVKYLLENVVAKGANSNTVLCGDFNFSKRSSFYRQIQDTMKSGAESLSTAGNINTWPCRYPIAGIDHVFFTGNIEITDMRAVNNDLTTAASDHLPLIADFEFKIRTAIENDPRK